jgi:hypothetical protein
MKKKLLFLFSLLLASTFIFANTPHFLITSEGDSVSVSVDKSSQKANEVEALKRKVKTLETEILFLKNAVKELQQSVFASYYQRAPVTTQPNTIQVKSKKTLWSCYLQDPFGKTFSGKGSTEIEASGIALKACGGGIYCKKNSLKCSSETETNETVISPSTGYIIETNKKRTWSCLLQDSFQRTFTSNGETEAEARGNTLKACGGGIHCKDENMSCSHN